MGITPEILETVGSGAGGGFLGALLAWLGIKARMDSIDKGIATLVTERECLARTTALTQRVNNATDRFNRIDANIEYIRKLLEDKHG